MRLKNKQVEALLDELQYLFAFQNYEWCIKYHKEDNDRTLASICMEEDYQRLIINIFPIFHKQTKETQRKTLIHELCHFLILPLHKLTESLMKGELNTTEHLRNAVERTTSQCENMIDGLLTEDHDDARKAYAKYIK